MSLWKIFDRHMRDGTSANPTAFDDFAVDYDRNFTQSILGRLLRPRVWEKLIANFNPGQHLLELACGTGEDAVWLAGQGLRVTATDGAAEMVNATQTKAEAGGVSAQVMVEQVTLQQVAGGYFDQLFDGVYSNFGGLNTIGEWRSLAKTLAQIVRPGGKLVLVPMGPVCPWEIGWHGLHGQLQVAVRRLRQPTTAKIGQATIPIWYPSAKRLRADFSPWFRHRQTESLGLWLPPSYLDHLVNRWPALFARLNKFEKATASLTKGWGDHYLSVFEKS